MKPLIVANWKMNPRRLELAERLFCSLKKGTGNLKNIEAVICPPFVYLNSPKLKTESLKLGAQNCFWEESGTYTGEVSPAMLKDLGVEYVIIGHSERRRYLGESDEMIAKKVKAALENDLKPVLCIGETAEQRQNGSTEEIIKKQLEQDLKEIENCKLKIENYLVMVYEPVWAISSGKVGSGNPCSPKETIEAVLLIRDKLAEMYERETAAKIRIIYGGSVTSQNAAGYMEAGKINGLLVGGASLDAEEFVKILKIVS